MVPEYLIRPIEYNIMNMRVGRHSIGTSKWFKALFKALIKLGYTELDDVEWKYGKPDFLRDHGSLLRELWHKSGKSNPNRKRRGTGPKFSKRIRKIIDLLRDCPVERLSFVTVISGFALTKEGALKMVREEGVKLERFIRSRFDHAAFVMFPEVDLVKADKIPAYLIPRKGWKNGIDDDMLIYKVHFHGVVYVPSLSPRDVELAFRYTKTNRKTKSYCGPGQVRSLPMNMEPDPNSNVPDVLGVAGYANKKHFKPPVMLRMLEGFADWVWLTHKIHQDQSLIRTGGATDGVWKYCSDCEAYHRPEGSCDCASAVELIDFDGIDDDSEMIKLDSSTESHSNVHPIQYNNTLNSVSPMPFFTWAKRIEKNISSLVNTVWKFIVIRSSSMLGLRPP